MSDNHDEACDIDEHAHCKTHAPGTPAEVEIINKMIRPTDTANSQNMRGNGEAGVLLHFTAKLVEDSNAGRAAAGTAPLRNIERELYDLLKPLMQAGITAIEQVRALYVQGAPTQGSN